MKLDNVKTVPSYLAVDPKLVSTVDEYIKLAADRNIKFTKRINVGFSKIAETNGLSRVIGFCTLAADFREIDIDSVFYEKASEERKKFLLFHELTHCYCGRDHDFDAKNAYLPIETELIVKNYQKRLGFFLDECPVSIMHPQIVSDSCIKDHRKEYINEMFDRCHPY